MGNYVTHEQQRVSVIIDQLNLENRRTAGSIGAVEYVYADYKKDHTPPQEGWKTVEPLQRFEGVDKHVWLRARFHTPEAREHCHLVLACNTGRKDEDATNPQGLLYLNGKMVQGYDVNHTEAYLEPDTDYEMYNYFYLSLIPTPVECRMELLWVDDRLEQLCYDLEVPLEVSSYAKEDSEDYRKILRSLTNAINLLDLRIPYSEEYYASIENSSKYLWDTFYHGVCSTEGKPVVTCVGHTHIDVEWEWNRYQTIEKIQRSFATAKALMDRYPEYRFMLSQPNLYQYLKAAAPEKYEELKALVAEGRWEPEGAMYLESDCNLVSGESFIRQIMHGKKFFRDEFGKENYILFLPDVFGYSAALPQILKKSGIRHFVTSKISWNDTNTMPVDTFLWQGIDGSEIFTNFITTQDYTEIPTRGTTYVGHLTPSEIKGTWNKYLQKDYSDHQFTTFGFGDGGGGPTERMLEVQRRLACGLPGMPVTKMGFLLPYLDEVREKFDKACVETKKTPRWVGELYLEFHRGTYTSIAKNKRNNRKAEYLLQKAETLSYTDLIHGGSYDAQGLWDIWEKVLHNQFHDIIPGSSIKSVYDLTDEDYAKINAYGDALTKEKLKTLSERIGSKGGQLVYNPLGFARKAMIHADGKCVETQEIPAFGWAVVDTEEKENRVTVQGRCAANQHYILELDDAGRIKRLYDKKAEREVLLEDQCGNELQVFEDLPRQYDNWEMSEYYVQKQWTLDTPCKIETIVDGQRAGFRVERQYLNSTIVQNIWLYSENPRIDFETEIDWHEHHQILKTAFPLDIQTNSATFEIQYGHVQRPTHKNTSWEEAKFEMYGHKWVDISDHSYGVSLLNDCKYGHNIEGQTLKLTILKCGTFPNPEADQGRHVFTYALLPHCGDYCEAGVIHEAYSLNQPLEALPISAHGGELPEKFSLACCDRKNVILETVKKAEDSDAMIVRAYEAFDERCTAEIQVCHGFTKAYLCDLMENELEELEFDGNTVRVPFGNFEIQTVKFVR